jgi:hypothetical protein
VGRVEAIIADGAFGPALEDQIAATQATLQWHEQKLAYRRSEARHGGVVTEAIMMWRRKSIRVAVENISPSGVMISFEGPLDVGEDVHLEFDGQGSLSGLVHWVRNGRAGIALEENAIDIVVRPEGP